MATRKENQNTLVETVKNLEKKIDLILAHLGLDQEEDEQQAE